MNKSDEIYADDLALPSERINRSELLDRQYEILEKKTQSIDTLTLIISGKQVAKSSHYDSNHFSLLEVGYSRKTIHNPHKCPQSFK